MLKIKRPLVAVAAVFILLIMIYDSIKPPEDSIYAGKILSLTGKITGIKKYDVPFGESSFKLYVENGPKELPAFFIKINESRLLNACKVERKDNEKYLEILENKLYGRKIKCKGKFESFEETVNPGQFDTKAHYINEGFLGNLKAEEFILQDSVSDISIDIYIHRLNLPISKKYQKILGTKNAGSLSAMILGDKNNLDEEIKELYQENAISHLLAISGLHISLVGGAIYFFLKKLKISFKFPFISASIILLFYGIFTGFSISTARAVIMMCIFFFSFIIGKSYDLPSSLAFAAIVIMAINHRVIYQSGFQLSFLAVIGIFYIMPELMYIFNIQNLNKKGIKKAAYIILTSVICSVSINIATLPVILINFYEFSITGILLNIVVIPLMSVLVITGLVGGFVALVTEMAGGFILGVSYYILNFYTMLCMLGNKLVYFRIIFGKPEKWQIVIYYVFVYAIIIFLSHKRRLEKIELLKNDVSDKQGILKRLFLTFMTIGFSFMILIYRNDEFSLNMLDIGQGDCFVVNAGNKNVYIYDCGSTTVDKVGKWRLIPFLKSKGWGRINTIFVSHMDKDHVNGVNDLLKSPEITIDKIVISVSYKSDELNCGELKELKTLAGQRKINLLYMKKDDEIKGDDISFKCIYPTGNETIKDQNEASIVMRMEYKGLSVLFTGDIASATETEVMKLADKKVLDCDILKVCHHGSKNSSSVDFLKEVDAKLYLISCGFMNRYGHPHKATLERMEEKGGRVLRTDYMGAVEIKLKEEKMIIRYSSKNLTDKNIIPVKECDCEDCNGAKVNTHLNKTK